MPDSNTLASKVSAKLAQGYEFTPAVRKALELADQFHDYGAEEYVVPASQSLGSFRSIEVSRVYTFRV
jgi:hydroxymethylpyrimidine/phosphomethylpyrimidine kinase